MTASTKTVLIAFNLVLMTGLLEWLYNYFRPDQNMGYWLAAAAGAFVIRFALPGMPLRRSLTGWLVGVILACLFATSAIKSHVFGPLEPVAVWGAVALIGDLIIQVIAWVIRLTQKLGAATLENPGDAFDETLERAEQLTSVWIRIKAPFLDLIKSVFKRSEP